MIKNKHSVIGFILAFVLMATIPPTYADASNTTHLGVPVGDLIALTGSFDDSNVTDLALVGDTVGQSFTVPSGKAFVLTDIITSPSIFPLPPEFNEYLVRVYASPSQFFTTALTVMVSERGGSDSTNQVNLTSGMVFPSGSKVSVSVVNENNKSINVSAFGYLVKK